MSSDSPFSEPSVTLSLPDYLEPPVPILDNLSQEGLVEYFYKTWDLYEGLFHSILDPSTYFLAPDPLRHPLIFYYGHTAVFYVNKLVASGILKDSDRINPRFETLFAKGVDPDVPEHLQKDIDWPSVKEVTLYRSKVHDLVVQVIQSADLPTQLDDKSPYWALLMALEHDRIHFETSSVLIRQYDADLVQKRGGWFYAPTDEPGIEPQWVKVEAGTAQLGKPRNFPTFGWDNEYGSKTVEVPAFEVRNTLITNAEFRDFVDAGGYQTEALWTAEGWAWLQECGQSHPKWWRTTEKGAWEYRTMFDWIELPEDWPIEANFHEALAYIRWLDDPSLRLPTEAEFMRMADGLPGTGPNEDVNLFVGVYNHNFDFGSPNPVGWMGEDADYEIHDLFGNVWEWIDQEWYPLDGFETHPYYEDFSAPYFDADHVMMLGGSWATTGTGASKFYRLWFRKHFYQHCGFRLVRNLG